MSSIGEGRTGGVVAGLASGVEAGRLPDFLVIGAMKSGSTSLHSLLAQHPRLFMSHPKEPAFFSQVARYEAGLAPYVRLFAGADPGQLCGESSTCYSRYPHYGEVPARIFRHLPRAKLIYILRHPVERMYSHYRHRMIERFVTKSAPVVPFERAIEESREYHDASLYHFQITKFLEYFERSALLILTTDALEADPVPTVMQVHRFLEIEPLEAVAADVENQFDGRFARNDLRHRLERITTAAPLRLASSFMPPSLRRQARRVATWIAGLGSRGSNATFQAQVTPLTHETRRRLVQEFEAANDQLEAFLGAKLPEKWRA
jgi:hypothetical protein